MSGWGLGLTIAAGSAAIGLFVLTAIGLVFWLLVRVSGYPALAARYPAASEPDGVRFRGETVQFGAVRFKRCVTLVVAGEGLYLRAPAPLLGLHPVLLPWSEVRRVEPARLFWRAAYRLRIGGPPAFALVVQQQPWSHIQPHLTHLGNPAV